jgi:hypothetical protein
MKHVVAYVENERLQVRNSFLDRHLDIEDIMIALYNAVDITKSTVSHGREEALQRCHWKRSESSESELELQISHTEHQEAWVLPITYATLTCTNP